MYAVHVYSEIDSNGISSEYTHNAATLVDTFPLIAEAVKAFPDFIAITVIHATDLPRLMSTGVVIDTTPSL